MLVSGSQQSDSVIYIYFLILFHYRLLQDTGCGSLCYTIIFKVTRSCLILCNLIGLYSPWNSPGQNTGVGSLSLLQGIFLTQGSNPCLPCCRQILYQVSHKGSPRILKWIAYPFSSGSFQPRNQTGVSCIAGRFFTSWVTLLSTLYIVCVHAKSCQWCPTLCDPMGCSPPRLLVHGILQARKLEWIAMPAPGVEPRSPALQAHSLPCEPPGKPLCM